MAVSNPALKRPSGSGGELLVIIAIILLLVFAALVGLTGTINPPPSNGGGKTCPQIVLAEYLIEVMYSPGGMPEAFTVSKVGVNSNLASGVFFLENTSYHHLGGGEQNGMAQ